ncbi:MAG TPA: EAL domain-containing protein [Bryobacteraceae bacterium]|nr:EAL domain-containing protein [Bryobacteraceae bacterium]
MIRHRFAIADLSIIIAVLLVVGFLAFEVDVFENEGSVSVHEETIELDEALSMGALLTVGLLIFAVRRYREQKAETRRRVTAEQHARQLAFQDPLTGLANRRQFNEALQAAIGAPPRAGAAHALFLLDLNGFKQVNDVYGHAVGDELLIIVGQRLTGAVREGDLVARLGGDEFVILSKHLMGAEDATSTALRVLRTLSDPIQAGPTQHRVGSGIGIALLPDDGMSPEEILRKADVALYRAKSERRSALRFFEAEMDRLVRERDQLEHDLRQAIEADRIQPWFQPTVDLNTGRVLSFEAIPRWVDAAQGEIPLERFIPIAEENGLIHDLFARVLRHACDAAARWPEDVTLALDVYPGQLKDRSLREAILAVLDTTGMHPSRLELEITESALVGNLDSAQEVVGSLRSAGVRIVLDNFGTGYSSLYHLRNFALDKIKIDRSFVDDLQSVESARIVSALVGLAHGLGLTIVADGVRESGQKESLLATGCEQGQGFLFSQALPAEETLVLFGLPSGAAQRQLSAAGDHLTAA